MVSRVLHWASVTTEQSGSGADVGPCDIPPMGLACCLSSNVVRAFAVVSTSEHSWLTCALVDGLSTDGTLPDPDSTLECIRDVGIATFVPSSVI